MTLLHKSVGIARCKEEPTLGDVGAVVGCRTCDIRSGPGNVIFAGDDRGQRQALNLSVLPPHVLCLADRKCRPIPWFRASGKFKPRKKGPIQASSSLRPELRSRILMSSSFPLGGCSRRKTGNGHLSLSVQPNRRISSERTQ